MRTILTKQQVDKKFNINPKYRYKSKNFLEIFDIKSNTRYLCILNQNYYYVSYNDGKIKEIFVLDKNYKLVEDKDIVLELKDKIYNMSNTYLRRNKIIYINLSDIKICLRPDLTRMNKELEDINKRLNKKCSELSIEFEDYRPIKESSIKTYRVIDDVYLLCMYYKKKCISQIELYYDDKQGVLEFRSYTLKKYGGKKYNKLLRSLIVILTALIVCDKNKINMVYSQAINPISAWLLINNFDTILYSKHKNLEEVIKTKKGLKLKEWIIDTYKKKKYIDIYIKLNRKNVKLANKLLDKLLGDNNLDSIKCVL